MQFGYTIENGKYALYVAGALRATMNELAILFDRDSGALLLHGDPKYVAPQYHRMQMAYAQQRDKPAMHRASESLTLVCGRFDPNEVNESLRTAGYVNRFYEKLEAQAMGKGIDALRRIAATAC